LHGESARFHKTTIPIHKQLLFLVCSGNENEAWTASGRLVVAQKIPGWVKNSQPVVRVWIKNIQPASFCCDFVGGAVFNCIEKPLITRCCVVYFAYGMVVVLTGRREKPLQPI